MKWKAWVTQVRLNKWLFQVCAPRIRDYLQNNELPLKALFLLDNAPEHPKDLQNNLLEDVPWETVQFLSPNTTLLIQTMDQKVTAGFKKSYTCAQFCQSFEACQFSSTMTLKKIWYSWSYSGHSIGMVRSHSTTVEFCLAKAVSILHSERWRWCPWNHGWNCNNCYRSGIGGEWRCN